MATILLVDDDQDILTFGKKVLASVGHDVLTAKDAVEGVSVLDAHSVDLVISDANMPIHSGYDLLKTLKRDRRFKHIPVALLTARRDREDVEQAIQLGVDDYIVKPIDPTLLIRKIDSLFSKTPPREKLQIDLQEIETTLEAKILLDAKILSVSEIGLVLETKQPLFEGQTVHMDSTFFQNLGILPPPLKILSCESLMSLQRWRARGLFLGTTDAALQKLRAWLNSEVVKRRARAA